MDLLREERGRLGFAGTLGVRRDPGFQAGALAWKRRQALGARESDRASERGPVGRVRVSAT